MRRRPLATTRRGVTIVEMTIAMAVTAVIGVALVRTMTATNRFITRIETGRDARGTSRAALNLVSTELRMIAAETGVEDADSAGTEITFRVPFRLGVVCSASVTAPTTFVAAVLPADTTIARTSLGYAGIAFRSNSGDYTYIEKTAEPTTAAATSCSNAPANITLASGMEALTLTGTGNTETIRPGTPVFLYRRVRYRFGDSGLQPGRLALWREVLDADDDVEQAEELASPFAAGTRFRYYINNARLASDTLPTGLGDLRGIELRLIGESARTNAGQGTPERAPVRMAIFFLNRLD